MEKLKLGDIINALGCVKDSAGINRETEFCGISTDTREELSGALFIALKGERFDAHDFAADAVKNGAVCAVTERKIDGCPCITVPDTGAALLKIAKYYRSRFNPILIGLTGSAGKTATKEMTALALSQKYNTLKTEGNLNNEIGLPKTLFRLSDVHEAAVIEMGMSDFGEIERLSDTAMPAAAVITNIGWSHVEKLKTKQGVLRAKLEILRGLGKKAPLFINADDKFLYPLKGYLSRPVITFGIENDRADFFADNIITDENGSRFDVRYKDISVPARLRCLGEHNILNALAAFSVAVWAGVPNTKITEALEKYETGHLRQNIVEKNGKTFIVDCYNAGPDSMKAALAVLDSYKTGGRRIAVLGDMLELGDMSRELHEYVGGLAKGVDMLFAYGNDARYIAEKAASLDVPVLYSDNKEEITEALKQYLRAGDTVLIKASRAMRLEEIFDQM